MTMTKLVEFGWISSIICKKCIFKKKSMKKSLILFSWICAFSATAFAQNAAVEKTAALSSIHFTPESNRLNDEAKEIFAILSWLNKMIENNWLGDKTGQGFFKKSKGAGGEKEILTLNLQTMEYGARVKPKFGSVEAAKPIVKATARTIANFFML